MAMKAINIISKNEYQGLNQLLLMTRNYKNTHWGTFRQFKSLGISIKKGEKGTPINYYNKIKNKEESKSKEEPPKYKNNSFAKVYYVFNIEQTQDYREETRKKDPKTKIEKNQFLENLIKKINPKIIHDNKAQAFYSSKEDLINIPESNYFKTKEGYYSTLFHELIHWTSHKDRCNRKLSYDQKTQEYAYEELIAELGSSFLNAHFSITLQPRESHESYIKSWLKLLENDHKYIFKASSEANKAYQYILSLL